MPVCMEVVDMAVVFDFEGFYQYLVLADPLCSRFFVR
jgi:hypothetical protein